MTAQCVLAALLLMEANVRTIREFLAEYRATGTAKKSAGVPRAVSPGRSRTGGPSHRASNRRPIQTRRSSPEPARTPDRAGCLWISAPIELRNTIPRAPLHRPGGRRLDRPAFLIGPAQGAGSVRVAWTSTSSLILRVPSMAE